MGGTIERLRTGPGVGFGSFLVWSLAFLLALPILACATPSLGWSSNASVTNFHRLTANQELMLTRRTRLFN